MTKLKACVSLAIPSIITSFVFYLQELLNLYYSAHSDNEKMIAAVGLGNVIINCLVVAII